MIEIKDVTKTFGEKTALNALNFTVPTGSVFGLIGSNGSGKSTLLRIISGVYEPDGGQVLLDGEPTFENVKAKEQLFFVSDFPYYYNNSTVKNLSSLYKSMYPSWSDVKFNQLCGMFPIGVDSRITNMSKGMQRQAALMLALSCCPKYLLLDEIFDGLDPVVRQFVKKLLIDMVSENESTIVIASHNLRELEDLCDHIGLLHNGGVVLEKELDDAKLGIHRVQAVFEEDLGEGVFYSQFDVVKLRRQGKLYEMTLKGDGTDIEKKLSKLNPSFVERLPLTLEEVFISEMEAAGYDINNILK